VIVSGNRERTILDSPKWLGNFLAIFRDTLSQSGLCLANAIINREEDEPVHLVGACPSIRKESSLSRERKTERFRGSFDYSD